jgi:hypothetical protein
MAQPGSRLITRALDVFLLGSGRSAPLPTCAGHATGQSRDRRSQCWRSIANMITQLEPAARLDREVPHRERKNK